MDLLTTLNETPLPTVLVIGGIIFLFLGIATIKKPIVIDITPASRKIAFIVGVLLIGGGISLMLQVSKNDEPAYGTPTPTIVASNTLVLSNMTPEESMTSTPVFTPTIESAKSDLKKIVITEVLGNPCGADSRNEFIELYNSGNTNVDLSGLWFTDGDEAERIISWGERYPSVNLGATTNSTLIPSHGFAVILAPGYPFVDTERIMPYRFPSATIILTVADGVLLGDEENGIEVTNLDPIVFYKGDKYNIFTVVSTYGSPILGGSPLSIKDDGLDKIPFSWSSFSCWSVQRIIPANEDIDTNWEITATSSPGSGNYP